MGISKQLIHFLTDSVDKIVAKYLLAGTSL
jgi:hypothetical protein